MVRSKRASASKEVLSLKPLTGRNRTRCRYAAGAAEHRGERERDGGQKTGEPAERGRTLGVHRTRSLSGTARARQDGRRRIRPGESAGVRPRWRVLSTSVSRSVTVTHARVRRSSPQRPTRPPARPLRPPARPPLLRAGREHRRARRGPGRARPRRRRARPGRRDRGRPGGPRRGISGQRILGILIPRPGAIARRAGHLPHLQRGERAPLAAAVFADLECLVVVHARARRGGAAHRLAPHRRRAAGHRRRRTPRPGCRRRTAPWRPAPGWGCRATSPYAG